MTPRRSTLRVVSLGSALLLLIVTIVSVTTDRLQAQATYTSTTIQPFGGSEIVDVSFDNKFAAVVGKRDGNYELRIVNLAAKARVEPPFNTRAALPPAALGLTEPVASSVAISPVDTNGTYFAIMTLREKSDSASTTNPGKVILVNINAAGQGTLRPNTQPITVGVNPESVDISKDGSFAVVANQGGTISVIDLRTGPNFNVQTITPVVANPPTPVTITPETVEIADNSQVAAVTLQTANAITILGINTSTVPATVTPRTTQIPGVILRPDGIAFTPDSTQFVTANELAGPRSVSLFRLNPDNTFTLLDTKTTPAVQGSTVGTTPEMATTGIVGNQVKAFFSFQQSASLGVYNVANNQLTLETQVALNVSGQPAAAGPEGVAFADSLNLVVVGNRDSRTVSLVQSSVPPTPTPPPNATNKAYLPLISR